MLQFASDIDRLPSNPSAKAAGTIAGAATGTKYNF
jgi:hypothetical protein